MKPKRRIVAGATIGAVIGLIWTFTIQELSLHLGEGENSFALLLLLPWDATVAPTRILYFILGKGWGVGEFGGITLPIFVCMLLTNSAICGLVGFIIGLAIKKPKN